MSEFSISSPDFEDGGEIPKKFGYKHGNVNPTLKIRMPPEARSIVLIMDDPDALEVVGRVWVHWVMWNISADLRELPENIPPEKELPNGSKQGLNDFKRHGYGGPCPPSGTHRYYFKIYALDSELDLANTATKKDLLNAMEGHILAECQLMGKYKRQ